VSQIQVLVAETSKDLAAEVIASAVAQRTGLTLLGNRVVSVSEVEERLTELPPGAACALVLVGTASDTEAIQKQWLMRHGHLVVLRVDIDTDLMHLAARQVSMDALLDALHHLLARAATAPVASTDWGRCLRHIESMRTLCRAVMSTAAASTFAGSTRRVERMKHAKYS
jgi:hypothetical protein